MNEKTKNHDACIDPNGFWIRKPVIEDICKLCQSLKEMRKERMPTEKICLFLNVSVYWKKLRNSNEAWIIKSSFNKELKDIYILTTLAVEHAPCDSKPRVLIIAPVRHMLMLAIKRLLRWLTKQLSIVGNWLSNYEYD